MTGDLGGWNRGRLILVEIGAFLVASPDHFPAPGLPVIPDLGCFVDAAVRRCLYQGHVLVTAGPLVDLPQVGGECQPGVLGLKRQFHKRLVGRFLPITP